MKNVDEYKEIEDEMNEIIDRRMEATSLNYKWNYDKEIGKLNQNQPFKYQQVNLPPKVEVTEDVKDIIFNEQEHPDDLRLFLSNEWTFVPITESNINFSTSIPSGSYIRAKKIDTQQLDSLFGKISLEGRLKGKSNELNYINYHYNLRGSVLAIYKSDQVEVGDKQLFSIELNERTFDYQSDAMDYLFLRGDDKNLRIFKDETSKNLIEALERKLLFFAFRGAYIFRNEVPDWRLEDYLSGEIDTIGPINFHNEDGLKHVTGVKAYREAIGGFLKLLERNSRKRVNKAGEIYFPKWLKEELRELPKMQTWLSTNIIPPQAPLMSLKIKVNVNEKKGLLNSVRYIFPYLKTYVKRSIVIYDSELIDEELIKILSNISYPMHTLGFPQNDLSIKSLEHTIYKSSDFFNEILDFSYNKKLLTIGDERILNLINNNPTIKKLHLKGCQIANGEEKKFLDALSSNICIEELELEYHDSYNGLMVEFLDEFDAILE